MRSEKGFSLIETMIGLVLVGIIGVAILSALAAVARSNVTDSNLSKAETLARSQMENIRSLTYNSVIDPLDPSHPVYSVMPIPSGYPNFSFVTPIVTRVDPNSGNTITADMGLQQITVSVKYNTNTLFTAVGYKVNR